MPRRAPDERKDSPTTVHSDDWLVVWFEPSVDTYAYCTRLLSADAGGHGSLELENRQGCNSLVVSNPTPLSLPKFSPSQEIALLFIVEFRAP